MAADQVHVSVDSRTEWTSVKVVGVMDAASLVEVSKALTDAMRDNAAVYVDLEGVSPSWTVGASVPCLPPTSAVATVVRPSRSTALLRLCAALLDVAGVRKVFDEVGQLPE